MLEQFREMEHGLCEISSLVGRVGQILSTVGNAAPETYLFAIRAILALQEAWSLHLEIESNLFPRMLCRNLPGGDFLKQIMETDQATEKHLKAILSAPWPRSPHSGLQSLRIRIRQILSEISIRIEADRALILSAISRIERGTPSIERVESVPSELVAI